MGGNRQSRPPDEQATTFEVECEACGLTFKVPVDRFKDEQYMNWIRATLSLQYTKEGLETFVGATLADYHASIMTHMVGASNCGNRCRLEQFRSGNFTCPNNVCDALKTRLVRDWRTRRPDWSNTTLAALMSSPEGMTRLFIKHYTRPADADCTALLTVMDECLHFGGKIKDINLVQKVRDSRNEIMHSGTMRLDQQELTTHIQRCVALLQDELTLQGDTNCIASVKKIQQLQQGRLNVKLAQKVESKLLDDLDQESCMEIERLANQVEEQDASEQALQYLKTNIKQHEEKEAKLLVLMEVYDVDTKQTVSRKSKLNALFARVESKLNVQHEEKVNAREGEIEQLRTREQQLQEDLEKTKASVLRKMGELNLSCNFSGTELAIGQDQELPNPGNWILGERSDAARGRNYSDSSASAATSPTGGAGDKRELKLRGDRMSLAEMQIVAQTSGDSVHQLQLTSADLSTLEARLFELINVRQLTRLELLELRMSHTQLTTLSQEIALSDNLKQVTLDNLVCKTHQGVGGCFDVALNLSNHGRLSKVCLSDLPFAYINIDTGGLRDFDMDFKGNISAQTSALACLKIAGTLQRLCCRNLSHPTSVEQLLTVMSSPLAHLQNLQLNGVDFGDGAVVRVSREMTRLRFVGLNDCTMTSERLKSLLRNLPAARQHRVTVKLCGMDGVRVRGAANILQEIRELPGTSVSRDARAELIMAGVWVIWDCDITAKVVNHNKR